VDTTKQRAILYEQSAEGGAGTATRGQIAWSRIERPDGKPAIRGVLELPDRKVTATIVITKNDDTSLPASHLIEITFSGEGALAAAPIERVPALVLKPNEQARGQPLTGAAVPVTEKLYWIALSEEADQETRNVALLRDSAWFDMPILFKDGKRAVLAFEKGVPGDKIFQEVMASWGQG